MDIFTLNSLYQKIDLIDTYKSLIWTERYSSYGDFELLIASSNDSMSLLKPGTMLCHDQSYRVMVIETVERTVDKDGEAMMKVSGRSLEKILIDRVAKTNMSNLTIDPKWTLTGTPANIVRKMFADICLTGTLSSADIISGVSTSNIFGSNTIPEPADEITVSLTPTDLYTAIKTMCDQYELGFRLVRGTDGTRYFNVYSGSDRTSKQTSYPAVIFASSLDNLTDTKELTSSAKLKNVAYVFCPSGSTVVYRSGVDPNISGYDRRVAIIVADDITDTNSAVYLSQMNRRAQELFAENKSLFAFDGESSTNSMYKYGVDYNLGDMVEFRNSDNILNNMRVTEYIFVSDTEGDRAYPTLTVDLVLTPGSWAGWNFSQVWADMGTTAYWNNQA